MATERDPQPLTVHIVPMRRRHLRSVLHIETQVYPRPWTTALFLGELGLRSTRAYYVARVGRDVVGYAGLMMSVDEAHITTIAVDPAWQGHHIGRRLLLAVARGEAIVREASALTLEVRTSNKVAQGLYRRFGFEPVGVPQGLLRGDERGRGHHVGPRDRHARVHGAPRRPRAGRRRRDRRRAAAALVDRDDHPRARDIVRRDRRGSGRGRSHHPVERHLEPDRPARRASVAWCPRSRAARTSRR